MSLNSKKSWHPSKVINRAKVDKLEEEKAEQERLAEIRRQERAQEQELAELRAKVRRPNTEPKSKLAWMYADAQLSANKPIESNRFTSPSRSSSDMHAWNGQGTKSPVPDPAKLLHEKDTTAVRLELTKKARLDAADPFAQLQKTKPKTRSDSRVFKPNHHRSK